MTIEEEYAVLVEVISVIVRRDAIKDRFSGELA
jgi:hypothetical protein